MTKNIRLREMEQILLKSWKEEHEHKLKEKLNDSEIIHLAIMAGMACIKVDKNGEIILE